MYLDIWVALLITATVPVAMVVDVCTRRIPNLLTFPLLLLAIGARVILQGWSGLVLGLTGALLAPTVLWLLHGGRGPGMGDLKLAAGIGAVLGPITAVASMLATAIIGGLLAVVWMLKPGGPLSDMISLCLSGLPWLGSRLRRDSDTSTVPGPMTFPYGVAIGLGALLILGIRWWTEHDVWFL